MPALDEFGPLAIRPVGGSAWANKSRPQRQPANYHKLHGVRQFHGCYSIGDDTMWGVVRRRKGADNVLAALRSVRAARPDGKTIYVILDNLSAHKGIKIRRWAERNQVELCFTPTYSSWANLIEAHFDRCESSCSTTRTTRTMSCSPGTCTPTSDGATPTLATPISSPLNDANEPEYEPRSNDAGVDQPHAA